jgi:thiosulfate/3-mercaptopyruvate sulfurtransferase
MQQINPLLIVLFLLISCKTDKAPVLYSSSKDDIKANNLINPQEAFELLKNIDQYIPIHVSKSGAFKEEHIPNALNIWRPDYASDISKPYGGLIPSKEKLQKLLQKIGFENGKTLLLYDIKANVDALRFAWVLSLYGFHEYKIINGGLAYWKLNALPLTDQDSNKPIRSSFTLNDYFENSIIASFEEVKNAIEDTNTILIDTREGYENKGEPFVKNNQLFSYKPGAFNRGSIPTAIHLNWSTFADLNGDHRIKSEEDLRYDLKKRGISPDKNIILYCQSGSRTSHTLYVLKNILGYENVKNYDGSWIEWSYNWSLDNSLPLEQICNEKRFQILYDSLQLSLGE